MKNHIELKNKVLLAGLQRVYNTDKIFWNQCAFFFLFSLCFFILASFQPWSSYHLLPDHTLLLDHWSTPSCGQSGRCFWAPGWSHKSRQHLLLQWLGQPRRSETVPNTLIHQVLFHREIYSENIKITVYHLIIYLTTVEETKNFSPWINNRPRD